MKTNQKSPHGWVVKVDPSGEASFYPFDSSNSLEQLQSGVGGWLEHFPLQDPLSAFDAFCDEEGILKGLPVNLVASGLSSVGRICGNVVICLHNGEGDTIGISDADLKSTVIPALTAAGAIWRESTHG